MSHPVRQFVASPGAHRPSPDARWSSLEREADRAAEQALNLSASDLSHPDRSPMEVTTVPPTVSSPLADSVTRTLAAAGNPLPVDVCREMEQRFGRDFSHVRVHADSLAAQSAGDVDAQAYTVGHHIAFAPGAYAPATSTGRKLLAHELAHVVQQSPDGLKGPSARILQRKPSRDASAHTVVEVDEAPQPSGGTSLEILDVPTQAPHTTQSGSQSELRPPIVSAPLIHDRIELPDMEQEDRNPPPPHERDQTDMPRLRPLLADRQMRTDPSTEWRDADAPVADIGELLQALASGVNESRGIVKGHAAGTRIRVDGRARGLTRQLGKQKADADATVHLLTANRLAQVDRTYDTHENQLKWLVLNLKSQATIHAGYAKSGQTDGFTHYGNELAGVFNGWSDRLRRIEKDESQRIKDTTNAGMVYAWKLSEAYYIQFVKSYSSQSDERKRVQREAADAVTDEFVKTSEQVRAQAPRDLAQVVSKMVGELDSKRDEALKKYNEALPLVLRGIDEQLAAAHADMDGKGIELLMKLRAAKKTTRERIEFLEREAVRRNEEFRERVEKDIEEGRRSMAEQLARAVPHAMAPIVGVVTDAVEVLTSTDEELDPEASRTFVSEVVDFSRDAAESTEDVFSDAGLTGQKALGASRKFALRGFAAGRADLEATFRSEGATNEGGLIQFGLDAESYLSSSFTDLQATFMDAVRAAEVELKAMVREAADEMRQPMEKACDEIVTSVNQTLGELADARQKLEREVHNAARKAAWKYDHPIRDRLVRGTEIFLGVLAAIAVVAALVITLPFMVGAGAAAAILLIAGTILAFLGGYYGAKAYFERREKGASRAGALFGALADITGITDVRRAFTDQKMSDFERGFAIGNFVFGLFGAGQGAARFITKVKLRLPKSFTNPFRFKPRDIRASLDVQHSAPGTGSASAPDLPATAPSKPMDVELPHERGPMQSGNDARVPPTKEGPLKPVREIGFLAQERKTSVMEAPHDSRPRREIGFRPQEKSQTPAEIHSGSGVVEPRLHHRQPQVPEVAAPTAKREIGFRPQEKSQQSRETHGGAGAIESRLHHRKPQVPEATAPPVKREIGFRPSRAESPDARPQANAPEPANVTQGRNSSGVIDQMPPARQVPDGQRPGTSAADAVGSSKHPDPRSTIEDTGGRSPTKGSVTSTVEPDATLPAATRDSKPVHDPELADELAVRAAREKRMADQERVAKAQEELQEVADFRRELGPRSKRDYIDDLHDQKKKALADAKGELESSRRAEFEAEAAERIHLKGKRDIDPAAANHDPEFRQQAIDELARRKQRLDDYDEYIKANEADVELARARVAEKTKAFNEAPPGKHWDSATKSRIDTRKVAKKQLRQAERDLARTTARTRDAHIARRKQIERMQQLDRVLNPGKYPELSADKGVFAEGKAHGDMTGSGYEFKGSSKQPAVGKPREQGLDGVYEKPTAGPGEAKHVVIETKYDQSKLTPGQRKASWVDDNLDKTVGREQANKMRREGYEYWAMKWNPKLQRMQRTKMWVWKPNNKVGPGGRVLGDPHLVPPE